MTLQRIDWRREAPRLLRDYALLVPGAVLVGGSFAWFFLAHAIAPGGVTGIAEVLSDVTGISVGLLSFLINLPLFLVGFHRVGWRFALRSFIAMTILSASIDLLPMRDPTGEMLLASLFGGALMGVGLGMVVRAGATTGGTDMAAGVLHKLIPFLSTPVILLGIDGLVILAAALRFGAQAGFYALLACFISTKAMDRIIKGFNTALQFTVITQHEDEIMRRILFEMDRGCTRIKAAGAYSGHSVGMLMCVVPRMEAARLKKIVSEADPAAFMTVCDVNEVLGEGFSAEGR